MKSSAFKKKVLHIVAAIPRGTTMSYKKIAQKAGHTRAYRAVGTIMAHNMNPAVPCHRVVKSDGTLGNYNRGGIVKKKNLLEKEGVTVIQKRGRYAVKQ